MSEIKTRSRLNRNSLIKGTAVVMATIALVGCKNAEKVATPAPNETTIGQDFDNSNSTETTPDEQNDIPADESVENSEITTENGDIELPPLLGDTRFTEDEVWQRYYDGFFDPDPNRINTNELQYGLLKALDEKNPDILAEMGFSEKSLKTWYITANEVLPTAREYYYSFTEEDDQALSLIMPTFGAVLFDSTPNTEIAMYAIKKLDEEGLLPKEANPSPTYEESYDSYCVDFGFIPISEFQIKKMGINNIDDLKRMSGRVIDENITYLEKEFANGHLRSSYVPPQLFEFRDLYTLTSQKFIDKAEETGLFD